MILGLGYAVGVERAPGSGRVGEPSRREEFRHVQPCHTDPVVGHPVIHVESIGQTEIVATIDGGGKHDVGDGPDAFLRVLRRQHRLRRTITDRPRVLLGEDQHPGGVA